MTGQDQARLIVVGANHLSSSAETRDRLFMAEAGIRQFLDGLKEAGIAQGVVLSTCDRTEIEAIDPDPRRARKTIVAGLARHAGIGESTLARELYTIEDEDAVHHVFSVVAALDSPVVGEPNIAGQFREGHKLAQQAGMTGRELDAVLEAAYRAAKRVRTETTVGHGPASMASVALRLARDIHGDLSRCTGMLIGGGEMGVLIADQLFAAGLDAMTVSSQVPARAEMLARRWRCHHASLVDIGRLIDDADIVVSSQASGRHLVTEDMIRANLAVRRRRPVFLVDAAVPGDIEPGCSALDGAFLYDLDDLEALAFEGLSAREAVVAAAREIVDREVETFIQDQASREVTPVVVALREHFRRVRDQVLAEAGGDADAATRLMMNRLLHGPMEGLRQVALTEGRAEAEALVRRLFGIDGGDRELIAKKDEEQS